MTKKRTAPLVRVKNTDPNPLMMVDEQKTMTARFPDSAFPLEINCPISQNQAAHVEVTLFRHTWDVFADKQLRFPALVNGSMGTVCYELAHEGERGGTRFLRYRKFDPARREIISQPGVVLPARASF